MEIQKWTKESLDITWSKYLSNDWIPTGKSGRVSFLVNKFYVEVEWKEEGDWIGQKQDKEIAWKEEEEIGQEEEEVIGVEKVKKRHQTFLSRLKSFFGKQKGKYL